MFEIAKFDFSIISEERLLLPPFKGSTLRGGFGSVFKRIICLERGGDCSRCILKEKCVYLYIFETPPPEDAKMMRKYPKAPHPFVLTPPTDERSQYNKGDRLNFELLLIGNAIDYLPYFIFVFSELGKRGLGKGRGKFRIDAVWSIKDGKKVKIFDGERGILTGKYDRISFNLVDEGEKIKRLRLNFITPTRIKFGGKYTDNVEFSIIFRNLLRRISLLSYFHCNEELDLDYKGMIKKAEEVRTLEKDVRWVDIERYSTRQGTRMKIGGFVGEASYEGELSPFLPFLRLGEFVHLGKGTSFGLGKYRILL